MRTGCPDSYGSEVIADIEPEETAMPLYMDVHHLDGPVTADDVAKAHMADLQIQD
jgi:hypothetical protein